MMLYDVLWCCMMLYDVIAVDFIPELCVFQLNAKLKPSYIPRCGIFHVFVQVFTSARRSICCIVGLSVCLSRTICHARVLTL